MLSRRERKAQARREAEAPLEVDLSVSIRFGDKPEDRVTMIDHRRVPMVGSVFDAREALMRGFVRLLLKAGLTQPRVLSDLVPALKLTKRNPKR
jgi:hypothetical protein